MREKSDSLDSLFSSVFLLIKLFFLKEKFGHHSYDALKTVLTKHVDLIDAILLLYSFHPETSGAEEIINLAHSLDIGTVAMKVFRGASESWEERVKKWQADEAAWSKLSLHVDENTSVGQACLKYVLKNPKLSTAIVGMQSIAQVEENARVLREIPQTE